MENRTVRVDFRATPTQKARWRQAATALGLKELSDFYRDAIDGLADVVLAPPVSDRPSKVLSSEE
jgi:uncharacterized protein (DUF1778 family)